MLGLKIALLVILAVVLTFSLRFAAPVSSRFVIEIITTTGLGALFGGAVSDDALRGALIGALVGCLFALVYVAAFAATFYSPAFSV